MYHDPITKTPGLQRQVKDHEELITSTRATLKTLNFLLGLFGIGGVVWFFRTLFGPLG